MAKITSHQTPKIKIDNKIHPDSELLQFAKLFSENYLSNDLGSYFSDKKSYKLEYVDEFPDRTGGLLCVGMETGILYMNRKIAQSSHKNDKEFIFLMIIWGIVIYTIGLGKYSEADKLTVQYFIDNDLLFPNIIDCFKTLTKHNITDQNLDRVYFIINQLANTLNKK